MKYSTLLLSAIAAMALTSCGDDSAAPSSASQNVINSEAADKIIGLLEDIKENGITSSSATSSTDTSSNTTSDTTTDNTTSTTTATVTYETLSGDITSDMTLTNDKVWVIDGLVAVKNGATLTIEPGTIIAGKNGTGAATSYLVIDKGSKILAEGTSSSPIIFTSKDAVDAQSTSTAKLRGLTSTVYNNNAGAVGQWGGLVIIGKAGNDQVNAYEVNSEFVPEATDMNDNSGILRYVKILNSGITMEQDKEINGLSLVGVGAGTIIDNITVDLSDDDGIEIWGGTVNLSNITVSRCTDDHFDIDDGYSGTVTNLVINQTTGNAAIEMSGDTYAAFDGFTITQDASAKEGGIYFKKDGIGGYFKNGTITDNVSDGYGALYSVGDANDAHITFDNVALNGSATDARVTGDSATKLEVKVESGTNNTVDANLAVPNTTETLSGDITSDMTLTKDKVWIIDGLVAVKNGATLTIEAGTYVVGKDGTGLATSYLVVDKGAKIMADGTISEPIIFSSAKHVLDGADEAVGQWGGLVIIGNAANAQVKPYEVNSEFVAGTSDMSDNSGVLRYVQILNSGITMEQDKEINGLSLVGVGSGTTIENIIVDLSDDDGIELWGGTVNLTNIAVTRCTDDYFDIDDGYSGTVKNLNITTTTGNAGIEMSGDTYATFDGFTITQEGSNKEGGIYFKKDGIGGHFKNGTVTDNVTDEYGSLHSAGDAYESEISFENVTLNGSSTDARFTGDSAAAIEAQFNSGKDNVVDAIVTVPEATSTLSGDITSSMTLTKDKVWIIDGLVAVKNGATLTIEAGTFVAGLDGTGSATSYLVVDKGAKIIAEGTATAPITFTSTKALLDGEEAAVGQWGGLVIIGNAANAQVKPYEVNSEFVAGTSDMEDNSGILKYVKILNSGITMEQDKEINGLSLVGVGSGTTIDNITVDLSDDDGVELWGGTVNLSNITVSRCTDDYFDIDDGYSGTVKNLNITTTTGNAAIEMSGDTYATFDGFSIVQNGSAKEGGIYFKKDGIGGHFKNGTVTDNVSDGYGALYSAGDADETNISFENVTLNGSSSDARISGDSATDIETQFDAGSGNSK